MKRRLVVRMGAMDEMQKKMLFQQMKILLGAKKMAVKDDQGTLSVKIPWDDELKIDVEMKGETRLKFIDEFLGGRLP
jgi:hypothetical protein